MRHAPQSSLATDPTSCADRHQQSKTRHNNAPIALPAAKAALLPGRPTNFTPHPLEETEDAGTESKKQFVIMAPAASLVVSTLEQ